MKLNCWEYRNCGREPGGPLASLQGTCPAATEAAFDRVHHGKNAGRACWVAAGTFCAKPPAGVMVGKKIANCSLCPFYKRVCEEEGGAFVWVKELRQRQS